MMFRSITTASNESIFPKLLDFHTAKGCGVDSATQFVVSLALLLPEWQRDDNLNFTNGAILQRDRKIYTRTHKKRSNPMSFSIGHRVRG